MAVSLSSERTGDQVVLRVSGDVDLSAGTPVTVAIAGAIASTGVRLVRVDLSAVTFLDSSGVALLLKGRRDAEGRGIGYQVVGARGTALQVLELSGVWAYLTDDSGPARPTLS